MKTMTGYIILRQHKTLPSIKYLTDKGFWTDDTGEATLFKDIDEVVKAIEDNKGAINSDHYNYMVAHAEWKGVIVNDLFV